MTITTPQHADPLGEILHSLHLNGVMYRRLEVTEPWGLALPPMGRLLTCHVVASGHCWLEVEAGNPTLLRTGDLALVPHGKGHHLVSEPGISVQRVFDPLGGDLPGEQVSPRYEILRYGGGGAPAVVVSGAVRFNHPVAFRLIDLLPKLILMDSWSLGENEWLQTTLRFMGTEARELRPGGETVITRLVDILIIQAIRWWIGQQSKVETGWLAALRDPELGRAITSIADDPGRDWSVDSLADHVAMSRSAFAARFAALTGETPMHYVTRCRMELAAMWLQHGKVTLADLAERLGYESEPAFSRAFKRMIGVSPRSIRRNL